MAAQSAPAVDKPAPILICLLPRVTPLPISPTQALAELANNSRLPLIEIEFTVPIGAPARDTSAASTIIVFILNVLNDVI
jgi:hypothetical protein